MSGRCRLPAFWVVLLVGSMAWSLAGPAGAEEGRGGSPSPRAAELLAALESGDLYQRQVAFVRLEALREPATVPVVERYLEDRDPDVRAYSVRALGAIQGPTAIPRLLEITRDRQPRVRRAALLALEPLEPADPAILPAFLRALRDRKNDVRMTAVDIVSRIHEAQAREAILTRYRRERDPDVRRVLELAMRRIGE